MINLYEKSEKNFKHNAYILNEASKAVVEEEINGSFELDFSYPLNDSKDLSRMLVTGSIIKVPTWDKRENQLFVIRRAKPSIDNLNVEVYAQHILISKLDNDVILDTNIVSKTRKQAIEQILNNTLNKHNFTAGSKDSNTDINNLRIVRYSPLEALIGEKDNTVINRYGGEIIYNNFNIDIVDSIGSDKGISVIYSKNITGALLTLEDVDLITEIVPVGGNALMIPEKSIKASNFDSQNPYTKFVEFSDIKVVEEEVDSDGNVQNADKICTEEDAIIQLREAALDKFNTDHINEVSFELDLNFIELADCIDFGDNDYSNLDSRVSIGDTINVYIKPLGFTQKGRIYSLKRDAITGKLISAKIGYKRDTLTDSINGINSNISDIKDDVQEVDNQSKRYRSELIKEDDKIKATVEDLDERTTATFQITANNIKAMVEGIGASTTLDLLVDTIQAQVIKDGFQSTLKQSARSIQIAWNKISNYAEINDSDGLILGNQDEGTYSKIGYDGRLSMKMNGVEKPYHCLAYEGSATISCSGSDYEEWSRSLPSMFNGIDDDDIKVAVAIKKVYKDGMYLPYWFGAYGTISNGDIVISAMSSWRSYSTSKAVTSIDCDYDDIWVTDVDYSRSTFISDIGNPLGGKIIVQYIIMA